MKNRCAMNEASLTLLSADVRLHIQRVRLGTCLAAVVMMTMLTTTSAARAADEQAAIVIPPAAFAQQFPPGPTSLGSPLVVLPTHSTWLAVPQAAQQGSADAGWSDQQSLNLDSDHILSVQRTRSIRKEGSETETVEQLVLTPEQPWTAALEIRYPFRIDFSEAVPSLNNAKSADSAQRLSLVLPLRNGWAKRMVLENEAVSAEYRLADTLTGSETPELALPVIQIDGPGHRQAAVMIDPRFSALFIVHVAGQVIEGEIRYRFRGDRVPIKRAESRWVGIWRASQTDQARPFGASIDAFFRMMLPDVPPGPQWLHGIAMVGYDYLSDDGQGWDRDVAKLAEWLPREERQHVALCFHGWYDGIGSYSFDDATGRIQDQWVAMPKTRKVALTKELVRQRLQRTRELGFRVLWYFGDGLLQDRGIPAYREAWNFLDEQGGAPRPTWTGPDTMDKNFIRNPAHPEVTQWYQRYLSALLQDFGPVVDGFVWDETYYIRRGDVAHQPEPAYCDRAMFDLVRALRKQVKAHDAEKVFLSSDDIGVFGLVDAIGYAMVADGNYQDSWCDPAGWSFALFPNWRNTSWSCNWWALTNFNRTQWGVENFGVPVAISNGWEDDRGPAEWTTAERDQFLTLFRKRLAMPERVRFLTDDPAKILATRPDAPPAGDRLPEAPEAGVNWALAVHGSQVSASSQQTGPAQNWPATGVIDGVRDDLGWGAGHGWASQSGQPLPQWIEVRFPAPRTIERFCIVTFQTQLGTEDAAKWGVKDYIIEVWDDEGEQWNGVVEENRGRTMKNRVHKLAAPVCTERFRVVIQSVAPPDGIARLMQVEAWGPAEQ